MFSRPAEHPIVVQAASVYSDYPRHRDGHPRLKRKLSRTAYAEPAIIALRRMPLKHWAFVEAAYSLRLAMVEAGRPIKLYGMQESGNCWKAATILALTGCAFEWVHTDGNAGETRTAEFLALNPIGKVPALELNDGTVLVESNAILLHFGEGTAWLPAPGLDRTRVHEWLFFEQYSHEPYLAVARNLITWQRTAHLHRDRLDECARKGALALDVMERRLAGHDWLAGAVPTVADLALFAYTHRADEGAFDLAQWPGVTAWVSRVLSLPGVRVLPRFDEVARSR